MQPASEFQLILQTIEAAQKPFATQQELNALGQLFDELKRQEVHGAATLATQLASEGASLEVQHFGFQLFQYLVAVRWNDFPAADHVKLAEAAFKLLQETGNSEASWAVRSKAALLLTLVIKRMGQPFWEELLPGLVAFAANGPVQAQKVCMVLRLVTEEVTWTNDGNVTPEMQGWRRAMLAALVSTLGQVLPFLHAVLESHFGQAARAAQAGQEQEARAQAATVGAAIAALGEFADWAPVGRLSSAGVISACRFLVATVDFRMEACAVLRRLAVRKVAQEDPAVFNAAMVETAEALMMAAETVLAPQTAAQLGHGGALEAFAQYVCTTLGMWGCYHLGCLPPDRKARFLQLVLQFTQQEYMQLAHKALPLWISLLSSAERAQRGSREDVPLPLDCMVPLMDLAGEKMRTGVHMVEESAQVPDSFESFEEYRAFLLEYRDLLSRMVKLTASLLPEPALQAASRRLRQAIDVCSTSGRPYTEEQCVQFEAAVYFVESVVQTVSQTHLPGGKRKPELVVNTDPGTVNSIVDSQEAMFHQLLGLHYNDPALIGLLARLLEAFSRLIALRKPLAVPAIQKVFDMFNDLPMEGGPCHLPAHPPPGWKERLRARSKIPEVLVNYAKQAPEAMCMHVEAVAVQTERCWSARAISPGERALLCDMMIAAVCGAELDYQQKVVEFVLRSTAQEWRSPEWHAHLASPQAMVAHFCPVTRTQQGAVEVGGGFHRWMAAHHLQLLERAVKRLPASADLGAPNPESSASPSWHVLNAHLDWALPTLLQMTANLHALSTPAGAALLGEAAAAMQMGARERANYLRHLVAGRQAGEADILEEDEATLAGSNVAALRSWVRTTRETLYQTLGWLARAVGGFYAADSLQGQFVAATTADLEHLQSPHVRLLIRHIMISLVKHCPPARRRTWLLPVLSRLLPHVYQRLTSGWEPLLATSGRSGARLAAATGRVTSEDSSAANEEVVQERLLRELTGEHLIFLRCMQDAGGDSVLEFTWREAPQTAMAACMTAVSALWWPDEVVARASAFLRGVVAVAGRQALEDSAGREMLRGAIQAISNGIANQSGEVMGLARDVLVQQPPLAGAVQVLLTLPRVDMAMVDALLQALQGTQSEKEQRAIIKNFLMASGSEELHTALSDWRPVSSVANVSEAKPRQPRQPRLPNAADAEGPIGLAQAHGT